MFAFVNLVCLTFQNKLIMQVFDYFSKIVVEILKHLKLSVALFVSKPMVEVATRLR